jgi:serine/threonine protein kinase
MAEPDSKLPSTSSAPTPSGESGSLAPEGAVTVAPAGPAPFPDQWDQPVIAGFEIQSVLGRGGMGVVYLARDVRLQRPVALKIPRWSGGELDTARARFLREARAAAALCHRNICPIYDLGESAGVPYLVMALVRGESLARRLREWRPMIPEAVALVRKVALAVEEAHRHGIVHRDLKPANIMIDPHGEPVIMDFGLAHLEEAGVLLTRTGELLGTPAYMPPEQFEGGPFRASPASDVYSLGVILYELLAGARPFEGDLLTLACQVTSCQPPAPSTRHPGLDPRLDAICLRALAKEPTARWPSMQALADALEMVLEPEPARVAAIGGSVERGHSRLTLRVTGTPYAYQPALHQDIITLGRQKRRPGSEEDQGNDVVLRVLGNDELSTRISRRHLEVRREGDGFVVIDRSKAGTLRNGKPLVCDVPVRLCNGDRLVVAEVVTLEVLLSPPPRTLAAPDEVQLPAGDRAGRVALLQVTQGDLVTVE